MIVDSKNWYLIRNTRGVTGFIGPDGEPVPLSAKEIREFGIEKSEPVQTVKQVVEIDLEIGDEIEIISGPFSGFNAKITGINTEKQFVTALIDILGRDTAAEIEFTDIKQ